MAYDGHRILFARSGHRRAKGDSAASRADCDVPRNAVVPEQPGGYQSCNMFYLRSRCSSPSAGSTRDSRFTWKTRTWRGRSSTRGTRSARGEARWSDTPFCRPPRGDCSTTRSEQSCSRCCGEHPEQYRRNGVRVLTRSHFIYLAVWAAIIAATAIFGWVGLAGGQCARGPDHGRLIPPLPRLPRHSTRSDRDYLPDADCATGAGVSVRPHQAAPTI